MSINLDTCSKLREKDPDLVVMVFAPRSHGMFFLGLEDAKKYLGAVVGRAEGSRCPGVVVGTG